MFMDKMPLLRRLLCFVVILAMVLCIAACGGSSADVPSTSGSTASSGTTAPTDPTTEPTTAPTESSLTKPTLPAGTMPTSAPPPEHLNLEFTLVQADVDTFY